MLSFIASANAAEVFSDDFDDNYFDTSKWSTNINSTPYWGTGYGLGVWETNKELKVGIDSGWTYALSKNPVNVGNAWTEITYSGRMKFLSTGTGVALISVRKGDSASQAVSFQYNDWENLLKVYENGVVKASRYTPTMPSAYTNFEMVIYKGGYAFYESGNLVFNITSTLFDDATSVTPVVGGWDGSHGLTEYAYFDDIKMETNDPALPAPENPGTIFIVAIATLLACGLFLRKK